jgi:hypothetical protein
LPADPVDTTPPADPPALVVVVAEPATPEPAVPVLPVVLGDPPDPLLEPDPGASLLPHDMATMVLPARKALLMSQRRINGRPSITS